MKALVLICVLAGRMLMALPASGASAVEADGMFEVVCFSKHPPDVEKRAAEEKARLEKGGK
jgi:hypothetical protein